MFVGKKASFYRKENGATEGITAAEDKKGEKLGPRKEPVIWKQRRQTLYKRGKQKKPGPQGRTTTGGGTATGAGMQEQEPRSKPLQPQPPVGENARRPKRKKGSTTGKFGFKDATRRAIQNATRNPFSGQTLGQGFGARKAGGSTENKSGRWGRRLDLHEGFQETICRSCSEKWWVTEVAECASPRINQTTGSRPWNMFYHEG